MMDLYYEYVFSVERWFARHGLDVDYWFIFCAGLALPFVVAVTAFCVWKSSRS